VGRALIIVARIRIVAVVRRAALGVLLLFVVISVNRIPRMVAAGGIDKAIRSALKIMLKT
jgi:hypothetical protein